MFENANNIEEILSSLDGIKRAEAPPFLYTKIQARLNSHRKSFFENLKSLISKPVLAASSLFLILLLDGLVLQSRLSSIPGKSDDTAGNSFVEDPGTTAEEFLGTTDLEEILIYELPYTDYAAGY